MPTPPEDHRPRVEPGMAVRCTNPDSYRLGQVGTVVEVVPEAPRGEDGRYVPGAPGAHGGPFAWVRYPDGIRVPHDLDKIEPATG